MLNRSYIKKKPKTKRELRRPELETHYWEWLKTQSCIVTDSPREYHRIDRSHISRYQYGAGMATKSADWFAIPLHHTLHRELEANKEAWEAKHGRQEIWLLKVWEKYGLDKIPQEFRLKLTNT